MNITNLIKHVFLVLFFISIFNLINGCDPDKYFGYNYDAEQISQTSTIFGTVLMSYTNAPVKNALIQIGNQTTFSDDQGKYSLIYVFENDEERDRPIEAIVSAEKYLTHNTSIIIYPVENQFDVSLVYAAPIIENSILFGNILQAIVTDYQGAEDIKSGIVYAYYNFSPMGYTHEESYVVDNIIAITEITSHIQCIVDSSLSEYGYITKKYKLELEDWHGYTSSTIKTTAPGDTLLFPIM